MKNSLRYGLLPAAGSSLLAVFLGGCGEKKSSADPAVLPAEYSDTSSVFPRLVYAGGELSQNDRCPVRKVKLNRRLPPLYVNGRPIGFC